MQRLTHSEVTGVLALLRDLYTAPAPEAFVERLLGALRRMTGSDIAGYNEYNPRRRRVWYVAEPVGADPPGGSELFSRFSHEHPLISRYRRTKDGRAYKISDFLSRSRLHRLGLYGEYFRRCAPAVEDLIAVHFAQRRSGFVAALALGRSRRDYTERERLLLNLVRPHMGAAYALVERRARLRRRFTAANGALEALPQGVIALDGTSNTMNRRARDILAQYADSVPRGRLPERLDRWAGVQRGLLDSEEGIAAPPAPFVLRRGERSLVVRMLRRSGAGPILLLDEHRSVPDPLRLRRFGLTRRESDVTAILAQGRSNKEIARLLGITPKTVEKHLERVYAKLGVGTRTAAAARALSPDDAG